MAFFGFAVGSVGEMVRKMRKSRFDATHTAFSSSVFAFNWAFDFSTGFLSVGFPATSYAWSRDGWEIPCELYDAMVGRMDSTCLIQVLLFQSIQ